MRNAVALGLPVLVCPGIHEAAAGGEEIEVDLASGRIAIEDGAVELAAQALPAEMREILAAGGILALLRKNTPSEQPVLVESPGNGAERQG